MKKALFVSTNIPLLLLGFIAAFVVAGFMGGINIYNEFNDWVTE